MAGLWSILNVGKTSLNTNQIGVNTTSHNISNVNTPGYSRQQAILEARDPMWTRAGQIGQGVDILTIDRNNTRYIHRQMVDNKAEVGFFDKSYGMLKEVEMIFSAGNGADIQSGMVDFFDSFKALSQKPNDMTLRENVRQKATIVTERFNKVDSELDRVQTELNGEIDGRVASINLLSEEISNLNREITALEFSGNQANDLRDRQEEKVRELAKIIKVNTWTDNKGFLNVAVDHGEPLVSGKEHYDLVTSSDPLKRILVDRGGAYVDITEDLRSGELAGIIDVRDNKIAGYRTRLDTLAQTLATEVNTVHSAGYGLDLTQGNFFDTNPAGGVVTAENITLSANIVTSLNSIAAGLINDPQSINGDNRNAIAISDLSRNNSFFAGSNETFLNHYQNTVVGIGHEIVSVQGKLDYVSMEETQLKNFRESIAGVNMDEELIELNKFQKAYEASSRIITTANDMLDTLLGLKQG